MNGGNRWYIYYSSDNMVKYYYYTGFLLPLLPLL